METANPLYICDGQQIIDQEYLDCVADIITNETFLKMQNYVHHGDTTCLKHCVHVSYCSFLFAKRHGMDCRSIARASLVHDLFLYDWHTHAKLTNDHFHGFTHPKTALRNAVRTFSLNQREQNIILRHMWPLTPIPPKYREGFVVMMMDKYCGIMEVFRKTHQMVPMIKFMLGMK